MSNQKEIVALIKSISGQANVLTIPRIYVDFCKSHRAALFLSQCVYWSDKSNVGEGWFYKSFKDWKVELGLNQHAVETAVRLLKMAGLLDVKVEKVGSTPTTHYRANMENIVSMVLAESANSTLEETANIPLAENYKPTITKTTTKTLKEKKIRPHNPIFDAIASVCGPDDPTLLEEYIKANGSWIAKVANNGAGHFTPEKIKEWYSSKGWWYSVHCKGLSPVPKPNPTNIQKTITLAADWDTHHIKGDVLIPAGTKVFQ